MAERNSYDFWTRYSNLCLKCKVCPLKSVIKHMRGTTLCCQVERIRSEHWQFLLSALSVDNSLTEVCFKSDLPSLEEQKELWQKRRRKKDESYPCPYGYSPPNISDICKYSARLLTVSRTLQTFIIENLPITPEDAQNLAEGFRSTLLKEFALRCYPYPDEVIETVCRGLWDSNVFLLDFSSCNLSLQGLNSIRDVIEKHKARRAIQAFPDTLRNRLPMFEEMMGLTRIILNGNNIGDKGVEMICEAISDDRWIQALDLQCCGITNEGAKIILNQITANTSMRVVDLRLNLVDGPIMERISLQLGVNGFGKIINHTRLPLWKPRLLSKVPSVRKNKLKTKARKRYSVSKNVLRNDIKSLHHAFRISCEILDTDEANTRDAMVQTTVVDEVKRLKERNKNLELTLLRENITRDSLVELSEKFKSETLKLRDLNENLRQENLNLRQEVLRCSAIESAILIDQETYDEIKNVFEKFQRFLQLMKDNGLWDLVTTIGVAEYENTRLQAIPSESKVCLVEKELKPRDERLNNDSVEAPPAPRPQRYCSCGNPECISNMKAEKEGYASDVNIQLITEEKFHLKNVVNKAKVTKVFKELRETYTNCDIEKQIPPSARATRKHSLGDLPSGLKSVPSKSLPLKSNKDIPNKFKLIKTRQDLYEAVKREMERTDCACKQRNALQSPAKNNQSINNQTDKNAKSLLKNVSSQTAAVEPFLNNKYQQMNPVTSSESVSQKSRNRSKSSNSILQPPKSSLQQAISVVSREWDEHVKRNFPDCSIEQRGAVAGAEGSSNSILVNPEYFKTWATAKAQEYLPASSVPYVSEVSDKEQPPLQSTPKSTRENVGLFSGNSISSVASEKKIKSNPPSYSKNNSNESYLESVSDASTDKDVKSLSGSELYESVKSDSVISRSSNKSSKTQKAVHESVDYSSVKSESNGNTGVEGVSGGNPVDKRQSIFNLGDKSQSGGNLGVTSQSGGNSGDKTESSFNPGDKSQSGGNLGVTSQSGGNSGDKTESSFNPGDKSQSGGNLGVRSQSGGNSGDKTESSFNPGDKSHSGGNLCDKKSGGNIGDTNSVLSNSSSKSSKKSRKQKKSSNQNVSGGGKTPQDYVSSSSVPSLSDITTVASHSLNTDSVMDQLSESEKALSQ